MFIRLFALAVVVPCFLTVASHAAPQVYKLDPNHTAVTWRISHFGFSNPSGKFMNIDGTILFDENDFTASGVKAVIPVDKGLSGVPRLDEHLQAKEFFDTTTYPTATFSSTKVEMSGPKTAKVTGDLTLRGVTRPVVLDVILNHIGPNMMKQKTVGFSASGVIKRSDFGMTAYLPDLGDEVRIEIESEANLVQESPPQPTPFGH